MPSLLLKDGNDLALSRASRPDSDVYRERWPTTEPRSRGRAFVDGTPVHLRDVFPMKARNFRTGT